MITDNLSIFKGLSLEGEFRTLSVEEANSLVLEHKGWCESIAKSVARAWNLDWQMDGLDGAALEALLFCARRYQPDRGVPFRGYARKRIHEASSDAARKSKGWSRDAGSAARTERLAREVSADLFNVFPELRLGQLPYNEGEDGGDFSARFAIQQLLVGASIIAAKQGLANATPDEILDYKSMVEVMTRLDPFHQLLIFKIYWEGESLRSVANQWETDELNVIREHKVLLEFIQKSIVRGNEVKTPRIRPGLKDISFKLQRTEAVGIFSRLIKEREDAHA
jgi:DNA-directed RNA polymerase specialized sigma subunit